MHYKCLFLFRNRKCSHRTTPLFHRTLFAFQQAKKTGISLLLLSGVFFLPAVTAIKRFAPFEKQYEPTGLRHLAMSAPDDYGMYFCSEEDTTYGYRYWDISATGTQVLAGTDDSYVANLPIGFDFTFYGTTYTEFSISSSPLCPGSAHRRSSVA